MNTLVKIKTNDKILLNEIIQVFPGNAKLTKKYIKENPGKYPVYSSATKNKGLQGNINTYMYDGEYGTYTKDGVYAGTLFYRNEKFNLSNSFAWNIKNKKISDFQYIFYFLKSIEDKLINKIDPGSTIKHFYPKDLLKLKLFLPNLIIQKQKAKKISELKIDLIKIKSILSKLSLFKSKLSLFKSKLSLFKSKLSLFKSKLSLFKSKLLEYVFYNIKNYKYELKDIINIYGSKSILTKKYIKENPGKYPVYSSATKNNGLYGYIDTYMYDGEYGTYTKDGSAGFLFYRNGKFNLYKSIGWNIKNYNLAMFNYVFLYLKWKESDIKKKCISGSMIPMFSKNLFLLYEIILPSLEKQKIISNRIFKFYFKLKDLENKFNNLINKYDKLHKKIAMLIIQKEIIY